MNDNEISALCELSVNLCARIERAEHRLALVAADLQRLLDTPPVVIANAGDAECVIVRRAYLAHLHRIATGKEVG